MNDKNSSKMQITYLNNKNYTKISKQVIYKQYINKNKTI